MVPAMSKCPRKAKPKTGPYQNSSEVGEFWVGRTKGKKAFKRAKVKIAQFL